MHPNLAMDRNAFLRQGERKNKRNNMFYHQSVCSQRPSDCSATPISPVSLSHIVKVLSMGNDFTCGMVLLDTRKCRFPKIQMPFSGGKRRPSESPHQELPNGRPRQDCALQAHRESPDSEQCRHGILLCIGIDTFTRNTSFKVVNTSPCIFRPDI